MMLIALMYLSVPGTHVGQMEMLINGHNRKHSKSSWPNVDVCNIYRSHRGSFPLTVWNEILLRLLNGYKLAGYDNIAILWFSPPDGEWKHMTENGPRGPQ